MSKANKITTKILIRKTVYNEIRNQITFSKEEINNTFYWVKLRFCIRFERFRLNLGRHYKFYTIVLLNHEPASDCFLINFKISRQLILSDFLYEFLNIWFYFQILYSETKLKVNSSLRNKVNERVIKVYILIVQVSLACLHPLSVS